MVRNITINGIIVFAVLVVAGNVAGEELNFPETNQSSWVEKFIPELSGEASMKFMAYQKASEKGKRLTAKVEVEPEFKFTFSDSLTARIVGNFRWNNDGNYAGMIDGLTQNNPWIINFSEAWIEWNKGNYSVRVGKQIFKDWSIMDTVSPMNVNPLDWTSVIDYEYIGVPAVSARYDSMNWWAQIVIVPRFTSSELPQGHWKEELPYGITGVREEWDENQTQFALRAGTYWNGFNLTAMFYRGVSYNPYGELDGTTLKLEYSPLKVVAGSISKEVSGGVIVKAEIAHYKQEHGDDFVQGVVAARKEFYNVFRDTDMLSILVQYSDEKITSEDHSIIPVTDFRRDLKGAILGRFSYKFGDYSPWKINIEGTINPVDDDYLVKPEVVYEKGDWEVTTGIQIVGGPKDSFLGKYDQSNAVSTEIKFNF